jgi:hypothetical protein
VRDLPQQRYPFDEAVSELNATKTGLGRIDGVKNGRSSNTFSFFIFVKAAATTSTTATARLSATTVVQAAPRRVTNGVAAAAPAIVLVGVLEALVPAVLVNVMHARCNLVVQELWRCAECSQSFHKHVHRENNAIR